MTEQEGAPKLVLEVGSESIALDKGETFQAQGREVDLCFVFDTTGSMNDKIDGLVACMVDFVRELAELALDWRISVVPFGDLTVVGDRVVGDLAFVSQRQDAESQLRTMTRNSGGSNEGESAIEAVRAAMAKNYRARAVKVLILLTDEPALMASLQATQALEADLKTGEYIAFVASPDLPYFRRWAETTGGSWYPIGSAVNTSAIVALLRGLASQLALVAHDVHAIGGGSVKAYLELTKGS